MSRDAELHELLAGAFDNEKVDQSKLARAFNNAGCCSRGLLLCQVDAREGKNYAKMQKPVATQQSVLPLCKKARQSQWSQACDRALREVFSGHTSLAFQFIPSDLWKTVAEPIFKFKVDRHSLKAKNIAVVVAIVLLPLKDHAQEAVTLVEQSIYQQGARLPKELTASLTSSQKEDIGRHLSSLRLSSSFEEGYLRFYGLDHGLLKEDLVYQQLLEGLRACRRAKMGPSPTCPSIWFTNDGQTGSLDRAEELYDAMERFLDGQIVSLETLSQKMGPERLRQTRALLFKELDQDAQHFARYSANFEGRLTQACRACGKPCANNPYPCPCQRPLLEPPLWPGDDNKRRSLSSAQTAPTPVGRRRGKKVHASLSGTLGPQSGS